MNGTQSIQNGYNSQWSKSLYVGALKDWTLRKVVCDYNPIPISTGRNQPIYEYHVTTAGRNRVKQRIPNFTNSLTSQIVLTKKQQQINKQDSSDWLEKSTKRKSESINGSVF